MLWRKPNYLPILSWLSSPHKRSCHPAYLGCLAHSVFLLQSLQALNPPAHEKPWAFMRVVLGSWDHLPPTHSPNPLHPAMLVPNLPLTSLGHTDCLLFWTNVVSCVTSIFPHWVVGSLRSCTLQFHISEFHWSCSSTFYSLDSILCKMDLKFKTSRFDVVHQKFALITRLA